MVAAPDLGSGGESRGGSSPPIRTLIQNYELWIKNYTIMLKIIFGLFCVGYGFYTFYLRKTQPEKFGKLEKMKEVYGPKTGTFVHIFFYSIVPLLLEFYFLFPVFYNISI